MQKVTVSITDEHEYELRARQRLDDLDSRSAAIRTAIEEYAEWKAKYSALEAEYAELQARYSEREDRISDLEEQLSKRSQVEEKIEELPDKIRASAMSYGEKRQRAIDRASFGERLKWKVTGVPAERIDEIGEEIE